MQPVIWIVQYNDGTVIREFEEDGRETVFNDDVLSKKKDFRYIGLVDIPNDMSYSIDLQTGKLILRGQAFGVAKEVDGRVFDYTNLTGLDFTSGVIQFKCSKPLDVLVGKRMPDTVFPASYNIGYKVDLPRDFCAYRAGKSVIRIIKCQTLISIDADSLRPCVSSTFLAEETTVDGIVRYMKI